jgi:hypothetical protein
MKLPFKVALLLAAALIFGSLAPASAMPQGLEARDFGLMPTQNFPVINSVSLENNLVSTVRPGDTIRVVLEGARGQMATFDVQGIMSGVTMTEVSPGRYVGSLRVPMNASYGDVQIVGHLSNGQISRTMQANRSVAIANIPPLPAPPMAAATVVVPARSTRVSRTSTRTSTMQNGRIVYTSPSVNANGTMAVGPTGQLSPTQAVGNTGGLVGTNMTTTTFGGDMAPAPIQSTNSNTPRGDATLTQSSGTNPTDLDRTGQPRGAGAMFVTVSSPTSGQMVPNTFTVTGLTLPHARVTVMAARPTAYVPGVNNAGVQTARGIGVADATGHFSVQVRMINDVTSTTDDINLTVTATDPRSAATQQVQYTIATGTE